MFTQNYNFLLTFLALPTKILKTFVFKLDYKLR